MPSSESTVRRGEAAPSLSVSSPSSPKIGLPSSESTVRRGEAAPSLSVSPSSPNIGLPSSESTVRRGVATVPSSAAMSFSKSSIPLSLPESSLSPALKSDAIRVVCVVAMVHQLSTCEICGEKKIF